MASDPEVLPDGPDPAAPVVPTGGSRARIAKESRLAAVGSAADRSDRAPADHHDLQPGRAEAVGDPGVLLDPVGLRVPVGGLHRDRLRHLEVAAAVNHGTPDHPVDHLHAAVRAGRRDGFHGVPLEAGRHDAPSGRVGTGWSQVRHLDLLVPDRWRPLHRLHIRRGARPDVRLRSDRVLRGAVHRRALSPGVPGAGPALVGLASSRFRDLRRLRQVPVPVPHAGHPGVGHRDRGNHALHRAAARRGAGMPDGHGSEGRMAADHRVRGARAVHLLLGSARPGPDRLRQG